MSALTRKFSRIADLGPDAVAALDALAGRARRLPAGAELVIADIAPDGVPIMVEGWACRYQRLADGGRQILALLIPGDTGDLRASALGTASYSVRLLTDASVAMVPEAELLRLGEAWPELGRALRWSTEANMAVMREWLVNAARRPPYARVAHLLCELWFRMRAVGLAEDDRFALPLTQTELGDALGLTPVTVNRVLQQLRGEHFITLERGRLTVLACSQLMKAGDFDAAYLHQEPLPIDDP